MSTMSATRERHTSYLGVKNAPTLFISALQKSTLFQDPLLAEIAFKASHLADRLVVLITANGAASIPTVGATTEEQALYEQVG